MNSIKINKIILVILFMSLLNPINTYTMSNAQNSEDIELNQLQPNVVISSLVVDNNLPEEGEEVVATLTVENEDNTAYSNLLIQLTLIPESSGHDNEGGDDLKVGTEIIQQLEGLETHILEITFTAPAGIYVATSIVIFNNLPIASSQNSIPIQILSPKIGDNQSPIIAILILVLFIILILFGQAIYDSIKLKNVNLHSNGKK
ncbi:MAG: hypothetical protein GPJ54_18695 [Candidatus Heimdallarchaeota archaeon]|nr:hypothetical protein [Candidatus Heimdallarchaeota archaeon]